MTSIDYVRRFGARWHAVVPASPVEWPLPRRYGAHTIDFSAQLPANSPEFGVLELGGGCIFGKHGWVLGANGTLLPDLSWYGGPSDRITVPRRLPKPMRLHGTCVSLVSDWSCRNYAHFLLDGLGRLGLVSGVRGLSSNIDYFYCPTPPGPAAAVLLDKLAIPPEKRVWASPELLVEADVLLVPSFPGYSLTYWPWLPRFLQTVTRAAGTARGTRRLYVSRRASTRHAVSEDELESVLLAAGFEIYEPSDHPTQPEDFYDAAIVVGAHGAGLANLAFCQPGTKVLEIIPTDNAYPFYYSLALAANLDYSYIAGMSTTERAPRDFGPSPYDFTIDINDFQVALDELVGK
jgi:capsular polysaccharide biosynthesis protein